MANSDSPYRPSPDQMSLWPEISGNRINGLGDRSPRRPTPIYWHAPDATPHGPLQLWFYKHNLAGPVVAAARARRDKIIAAAPVPVAERKVQRDAADWTTDIKGFEGRFPGVHIGITRMRPEWVFEGMSVDASWLVMIAVAMDFELVKTAPSDPALAEIIDQYGRGLAIAKHIADWIRGQGWPAHGHCGPEAGAMLLIPPAIEAGLGELGKHGSLINPRFGSCFRLACVQTDLPLLADQPRPFGADGFCGGCQVCDRTCPPKAIAPDKQWVRGTQRWYVDFDRCLPYFNENASCGICLAVCPWSRPGVAPRLTAKLAARKQRRGRYFDGR